MPLMPREKVFFELFNKAAANAHETAKALQDLVDNFTDIASKAKRIGDLEHTGDEIAHTIYDSLSRTFITPIDREDIQELTGRMDDIADAIHAAADRLVLYKVDTATDDARALAKVLVSATGQLVEAFKLFNNFKYADRIRQYCIEVHTLENEGDRIYHHALAELFRPGTDPLYVIKWKDIYSIIEQATDVCEDVTNVLHNVVMKNA
jgi:uncharacterized protein